MSNKVFFLIFLIVILNGSYVYAADVILSKETFGYGRTEKLPLNISNIVINTTVNESNFWITDEGVLGTVNSTQFENNGGTLSIMISWLNGAIGDVACLLSGGSGCTMQGDIDMSNNNLDNVDNITIDNNIFFGDLDHALKRGTTSFSGLGDDAFVFEHMDEQPEGSVTFMVIANKTNSDNEGLLISAQIGLNESNSILGNSWIVVINNLTTNLTQYHSCFLVAGLLNETLRVQCDSSDSGADFIVQDDIQSFGTMFADGGIRAETLVDFIMNGEDVNIQNGGLHIFSPVTFEQGVVEGNEVTTFIEVFSVGLGSFTNIQDDLGNWFVTSNILCDDGDCANAVGVSGVGNIIIEANISTVNINSTSLNFIYSLSNMLGANDFEVTVNNNVGSGEISIFTDSTNDVIRSSQSIALPSSMSNQPSVSIRFNCDVTNTNRQCFVDTISVNGTAISTTLTNVSGFDSVIKFSDGALAADGFPERGIIYNASSDTIIIRGNATFENIIEQDLNITSSITLNSSTIFDWADIVNTPLFPESFLTNGSSVMQANANFGGNDLDDVGLISNGFGVAIDVPNRALVDVSSDLSYDFEARTLFPEGGGSEIFNHATTGLAQFFDSNITTTGTVTVGELQVDNINIDGSTISNDVDDIVIKVGSVIQMIINFTNVDFLDNDIINVRDILSNGGLWNITNAGFFQGDGSQLTGITHVTDQWKTTTSQTGLTGNKTGSFDLTTTGNITAGDFATEGGLTLIGPVSNDKITLKMNDLGFQGSSTIFIGNDGNTNDAFLVVANTGNGDSKINQDVRTFASPTFQGLTVNSGVTFGRLTLTGSSSGANVFSADGNDGADATGQPAGNGQGVTITTGNGGRGFSHQSGNGGDYKITLGTEPGDFGQGAGIDGRFNITGGEAYFSDVIFADRLVLGQLNESVNSSLNISSGDGLFNFIYANGVFGRSFLPKCDIHTTWCKIESTEYDEALRFKHDGAWNVEIIRYKDQDYTKQEFNQQVCSQSNRKRNLCDGLNNKILTLQTDYQADALLKQQEASCNYRWNGKQCFEIVRTNTTYEGAIEIVQVPEIIQVVQNVTRLNFITLRVEVITKSIEVETGEMIDKAQRKDGCDWDGDYYCEVRELR